MNREKQMKWRVMADLADIVESDEDVKARIRLATEWHLSASEALAEGNIDQFLSLVSLAGYSADRTRFGQYNDRIPSMLVTVATNLIQVMDGEHV